MVVERRAAPAALLAALLPVCALAHHSTAVFERDKVIELRGVVVDFKLRSPHSSLVVDGRVVSEGQRPGTAVERWELESEALPVLRTMGIDGETFKPGDAITVMASPHRDPDFKFAHAQTLMAADGRKYGFASINRVYSPSLQALGGNAPAPALAAVPEARGIARLAGRWQQPLAVDVTESVLPLNERGIAARSSYDRKLSPANTCEPMTVPDVFMAPFYLFEVQLDGTRAVLHNEVYDILRTVPLDGTSAPADPSGVFGTVRGRIEGEALVVESGGFPPSKWGLGAEVQPFGAGADVPSSDGKVVTERYTVTPDGRTLVLEYTLHDPMYMTMPYQGRVELTRVPDSVQMYPYECDVESAAMWSRTRGDQPLRVDGDRPQR